MARFASRGRRLTAAAGCLFVVAAACIAIAPPVGAAPANGTDLLNETFTGSSADNPNIIPLNDACLTAATQDPPAGGSALGPCTETEATPPNDAAGGWLQLTDRSYSAKGGIVYNQALPANAGIQVDYSQWQYGGAVSGSLGHADGVSFFLVDGSADLDGVGGYGGSLGYAQKDGIQGVNRGYLGVGLDAYGNFANDSENRGHGCPAGQQSPVAGNTLVPNTVVIRGPMLTDRNTGYCYLDGTVNAAGTGSTLPGSLSGDDLSASRRDVRVTVSPDEFPTVTVEIDFSGTGTNYQTVLSYKMTTAAPATWKFGFAASTGGGTDVHLIRTVKMQTVDPLPAGINLVKQVDRTQQQPSSYTAGDTVPYQFVVTNPDPAPLEDVAVTDPKVAHISCPRTTLGPAGSSTASMTCSGSHLLTETDTARTTSFSNTATATAISDGDQVSSTSTATVPITAAPNIVIHKAAQLHDTGVPDHAAEVGESITYSFLVTNAGNVPLTSVGVTDSKVGEVSCPDATLAPLATTTCTADYTVRQADIDAGVVHNSATSHGAPPTGAAVVSDPSTADVPTAAALPAILLSKDATLHDQAGGTAGLGDLGERISYGFTVTNAGNVTLTGVAVTDSLVGAVSCAATTLAPQAGTDCTSADHVITGPDIEHGAVVNTATASGQPPAGGRTTSVPATATVPTVAANPQLAIVKTATLHELGAPVGDGEAVVDDTITYSYLVRNIGNVPVSGIGVTDAPLGGVSCGSPAPTLAPAATVVCTPAAAHTVTQADVDHGSVDNSATAHGSGAGRPVVSLPDTASVPTQAQVPELTIVKTATLEETQGDTTDGLAEAGDTVHYSFLVTNAGNVTLHAVGVTDSKVGTVTCPPGTLAPQASTTCTAPYTVTQADVDAAEVVNTATAHGVPPGGTDAIQSPPDDAVVPANHTPGIALDKRATLPGGKPAAEVGDLVTYTFTVTNTGTTTLSPVTLTDPMFPTLTGCPTELAGGGSGTCTATHTVTQADVDAGNISNTATATGTPPGAGAEPVTAQDSAVVPTVIQHPAVVLVKSATINDTAGPNHVAGRADLGETVTYGFDVYNTGNVTLTGVGVTDPLLDPVECLSSSLAPQAHTTCTAAPYPVTQADILKGRIVNVATVTGTAPNQDTVTDSDGKIVPTATPNPSIVLAKAAHLDDTQGTHPELAEVGETISYTFTVTNNGNLTVNRIAVDDPTVGPVTCTEPAGGLPPATSTTCTSDAPHPVTQTDVDRGRVDNTATASAAAPGDNSPTVHSNQASAAVPTVPQVAALSLTKDATLDEILPDGVANRGETVHWTFQVVNTGNVTLHTVAVHDATAGEVSCDATTLAPGATTTCHAVNGHLVVEADILAGSVDNTATATGRRPSDSTVTSGPASTSVPTHAVRPALVLIKKADLADSNGNGWGDPGETITYSFLVINIGNVTVHGVHVDDSMFGGSVACTPSTLPPSASVLTIGPAQTATCGTHTHTITDADAVYGFVHNQAKAMGTDPGGTSVISLPSTRDVLVRAPLTPARLTLTKKADTATTQSGGRVGYTLTVRNSGQLSTDTTVTDDLSGVLDDATWNNDAAATSGTLSLTGTALTWSGTVEGGAAVTITYSVTASTSSGARSLLNTAAVAGGTCIDGAAFCATSTLVEQALPNTGSPAASIATLAAILLLAGTALQVVGRRRNRGQRSLIDRV